MSSAARRALIRRCLHRSEKRPKNIFCLGCAVKVPLRDVVYPALRGLRRRLSGLPVSLAVGDDAFVFETDGRVLLTRKLYAGLPPDRPARGRIRRDASACRPSGLVLLSSFLEGAGPAEVEDSLYGFLQASAGAKRPLRVGKGHTIQISKVPAQRFILADYLSFRGARRYGAASHDSIVTIDFNLKHSHWLNVFVSLNNALNDLFALGVHEDITIHPAYDSLAPRENVVIRRNLARYMRLFAGRGWRLADHGPLGLDLDLIGGTVVGFTAKEPPRVSGLVPGQTLVVTRPIGDLAALVLYILKRASGQMSAEVRDLKADVLARMAAPNVAVARIISAHLPGKGEAFDPRRHITATKDVSGEGLSALEDLAAASCADVRVDDIRLHDPSTAALEVPNNTSNTNGAVIIAAQPDLARRLMRLLRASGADPWVLGRVGARNPRPVVHVAKSLRRLPFIARRVDRLFKRHLFV